MRAEILNLGGSKSSRSLGVEFDGSGLCRQRMDYLHGLGLHLVPRQAYYGLALKSSVATNQPSSSSLCSHRVDYSNHFLRLTGLYYWSTLKAKREYYSDSLVQSCRGGKTTYWGSLFTSQFCVDAQPQNPVDEPIAAGPYCA